METDYFLSEKYWDDRYESDDAPWVLDEISPPLKHYIDGLTDKDLRILIPGGGYGNELAYLHEKGFKNAVLVDFSMKAIEGLQQRYPFLPENAFLYEDFFRIEQEKIDLILEQTFFCALDVSLRKKYFDQSSKILGTGGKLVGVYFDFPLKEDKGPPFGGSAEEYLEEMKPYFNVIKLERCYNSVPERSDKELFLIAERKEIIRYEP